MGTLMNKCVHFFYVTIMRLICNVPTWQKNEYRLVNPTLEYEEGGIYVLMWNLIDVNDVPETFSLGFNSEELKHTNKATGLNPLDVIVVKLIEESVNWIVEDQVKNNPIFRDASMMMKSNMRLEARQHFINNNKTMIESMKNMLNEQLKEYFNSTPKEEIDREFENTK